MQASNLIIELAKLISEFGDLDVELDDGSTLDYVGYSSDEDYEGYATKQYFEIVVK